MTPKSVNDLNTELQAKVLSTGRRTTAQFLRDLFNDIFVSYANVIDGGNVFQSPIGYSSQPTLIDPLSFVNVGFIPTTALIKIIQTTGTGSAYVLAQPLILNYNDLIQVTFKVHAANIGSSTIKFNTLANLNMKLFDGKVIKDDYLTNGMIVTGIIDGSDFKITSTTANLATIF